MNPQVNAIANRLSLRPPQREALEILDRICEIVPLKKDADVAATLETVMAEFETVTDFERDFPSLCFALATGVGKTRLMGAFITYLFRVERKRHFFVLAPNLTIYNKLITDFTPNTTKYVFQGVAEFANTPPVIITGDNYESGLGVRSENLWDVGEVHVNVFNISKINTEVRGGNAPRIKRLSEYVGESYFEYLSKLDDLVLLMDESHRYRATAGVRAINELRPILGLELTATPQVETTRGPERFKNIIYEYPLSSALRDGFAKEPAVATRENFNPGEYDPAGLERLKLEDGVRFHENTKVELEVYARENEKPLVKPFMLVVAQDTSHADALVKTIEDDSFFEGRYKGKVITVHSGLKGEEKDDTVQQLLSVEDPANPVEIVVHVNMLKEGWDVTNLYTIVPLRTANSKTLVEQSIGRGLRLPYGKRVGHPAVDRLTIVSHDRFQEIIDEANRPDSVIRTGIVLGRDVPGERMKVVVVEPLIEAKLSEAPAPAATPGVQTRLFDRPAEREVAKTTLWVIREFEKLPRSADLEKPEVQEQIAERVTAVLTPKQYEIEGTEERVDVVKVVKEMTEQYVALSIDIPCIVVTPKGEVTSGFRDFDLDVRGVHLPPVDRDIIAIGLQNGELYRLGAGAQVATEVRLEDYLVRGLINYDEISYDDNALLLYRLAKQMVDHLRSYLADDEEVENVLMYHHRQLVALIHAQMMAHYEEKASEWEVKVTKGFRSLRASTFSAPDGTETRNFRVPVDEKQDIRRMLFGGFSRCLYPIQKFDVDTERRFAAMLETDHDVLKWVKPAKADFQIHYRNDAAYEPDFVVETKDRKYLCEPKRERDMEDPEVIEKARAAALWCERASDHAHQYGGKPWSYLLIPHNVIADNQTLKGLAATYTFAVS